MNATYVTVAPGRLVLLLTAVGLAGYASGAASCNRLHPKRVAGRVASIWAWVSLIDFILGLSALGLAAALLCLWNLFRSE